MSEQAARERREVAILAAASAALWAVWVAGRTRLVAPFPALHVLADREAFTWCLALQALLVAAWRRALVLALAAEVRSRLRWPRAGEVAAAAGLALLASITTARLRYDLIFPTWVYLLHCGLFVLLAGSLLVVGMRLRRARRRGAGPCVTAAAALCGLAITDPYVLLLRHDTIGPGLELCFTHVNWHRRFVTKNEANFWERSLAPYEQPAPGRVVVACVGDSFTFGQGVAKDERFTERLEGLLRAPGRDVHVLNFGRGNGATSTETEWILGPVAKLRPRVVVVGYLSNDIDALELLSPPRVHVSDATTTLLVASPTLNFLYWRTIGPVKFSGGGRAYMTNLLAAYLDAASFEAHLAAVRRQIEAIRSIGARPVFAILPFPTMWEEVNPAFQARVYGRLRATVEAAGGAVVELQGIERELPGPEFQLNPMDGHPNAEAHRRIAARLGAWFAERPELLADQRTR